MRIIPKIPLKSHVMFSLFAMNRQPLSASPVALSVPRVPAWAVPRGRVEGAFMAGSALNALDDLVQAAAEGRGAWRHRLAPKAAGACMELIDRSARTKRHCATPGMATQAERLRAVAPKLRSRPPAMSLDGCSATMCGVGNVDQKICHVGPAAVCSIVWSNTTPCASYLADRPFASTDLERDGVHDTHTKGQGGRRSVK